MDDYMTAEQLADFLGFSVKWVYTKAQLGLLPGIKVGKRWFFRRAAIEQWLLDLEAA